MYLYFNREGVLKEIVNDKALRQGSQDYNDIYIYVEDLDSELVDSVWFKFVCQNGEVMLPEVQLPSTALVSDEIPYNNRRDLKFFEYKKPYLFYKIPTTFEADQIYNALDYAGIVTLAVRFNTSDETIKIGLVVFNVEESNEGTQEIQSEEWISLAQWNYLLQQFKNIIQSGITIANSATLLDLYNKIGVNPAIVQITGKGTYLIKLELPQQGHLENISFEAERYSGGITAGQDRYAGYSVESETVLNTIFNVNSPYFRPYLVTNVPFDMHEETLGDIYARISNKAAIIRLNADDLIENGFYLIKMENVDGAYSIEAERIGQGNNPINSSASLRFISNSISGETLIEDFFNTEEEYYQPYTELSYLNDYFYNMDAIDDMLADKQDVLTAGAGITITGNVISADVESVDYQIVQQLPQTGEKGVIYLVPKTGGTSPDIYDEYIWIESTSSFEFIGSTAIDLSDYARLDASNAFTREQTMPTLILEDSNNYRCYVTYDGAFQLEDDVAGTFLTIGANKVINANDDGYGLALPNTANLQANSEIIDSATDQTITGVKTFDNYIEALGFQSPNNSMKIYIGGYNTYTFDGTRFYPIADGVKDLGVSWAKWKDLYLSGDIYQGGIAQNQFRKISSVTSPLTSDQIDAFRKGCIIDGGISGVTTETCVVLPGFEYSGTLRGFIFYAQFMYSYIITLSSGALALSTNDLQINVAKVGTAGITMRGNITPDSNGARSIGTASYHFNEGYINTFHPITIELPYSSTDSSNGSIIIGSSALKFKLYSGASSLILATKSALGVYGPKLEITGSAITPNTNNGYSLGSNARRMSAVYANEIRPSASVNPLENGVCNLGGAGNRFNNAYIAGNISDGTNSVTVANIAQKGTETALSATLDSTGSCYFSNATDSSNNPTLSDGLYVFTYSNAEAFVFITESMITSSSTAPIKVPCSCVYDQSGSSRMGTLYITKTTSGIKFRITDYSGNQAYTGLGAYLIKTKLA